MKSIDHIGIAVTSLEAALPFYTKQLGMKHLETEIVETEKVRVAILDCAGVRVELLEPLNKDSTIAHFIEKRGAGVHHMAYASQNIHEDIERLSREGFQVIQPAPRNGAGGCLVAFVHPKSTGGVLVELVQRNRA